VRRPLDVLAEDSGFSGREERVLLLMADGLTDKEIAFRLGVSRFTINKHVGTIMAKLDSRSRTEAVVRALKAGIIR
jgi:DNA-binding NarL/FixJ family response regulator